LSEPPFVSRGLELSAWSAGRSAIGRTLLVRGGFR
jgi:hypothetical protein